MGLQEERHSISMQASPGSNSLRWSKAASGARAYLAEPRMSLPPGCITLLLGEGPGPLGRALEGRQRRKVHIQTCSAESTQNPQLSPKAEKYKYKEQGMPGSQRMRTVALPLHQSYDCSDLVHLATTLNEAPPGEESWLPLGASRAGTHVSPGSPQ